MSKEEIKEWIRYNKSKTAALIVSSCYLVGAIFTVDLRKLIAVIGFLAISLACIFFGDIMGGAMGKGRGGGVRPFDFPVPEGFMVFMGWVFLLLPVLCGIFTEVFK